MEVRKYTSPYMQIITKGIIHYKLFMNNIIVPASQFFFCSTAEINSKFQG